MALNPTGSLRMTPGHILAVEDDPRMQKVLMRIFTADGLEVRTACDGAEALTMFRESEPTAMLLYLVLPECPSAMSAKKSKRPRQRRL